VVHELFSRESRNVMVLKPLRPEQCDGSVAV